MSSYLQPQHSADTLLLMVPQNRIHNSMSSSDSELVAPSSVPVASPRKNKLLMLQERFRSFGHRENSLDVPKISRNPSETSDGDTSDGPSDDTSPREGPKQGFRFDLRRIRSKQKSIQPQPCFSELSNWTPVEVGQWRNSAGIEVGLRGTRLDFLSESERNALKRVAFARLQRSNLGVTINRPKEATTGKSKRQKYIKQVRKAQTLSVPSDKREGNRVFGISLAECLENDQRNTPPPVNAHSVRCKSLELSDPDIAFVRPPSRMNGSSPKMSRTSLSDQGSSTDSNPVWNRTTDTSVDGDTEHVFAQSAQDLYPQSCSPSYGFPKNSTYPLFRLADAEPHNVSVPSIVETCCSFLEERGLNTVGLFRIAGSKKRCREMRTEIDSGQPMLATASEFNAHDVATLLKEYFRDLPQPLLTKELYSAFLAAARFPEHERIEILRLLVIMLPTVNTDTFHVLLRLLRKLSMYCSDIIDNQGVQMTGNKMNSANLATVFAPTVLWPSNSPKQPCPHEENEMAITAMETLIDHADHVFHVPVGLQHEMLLCLLETEPDVMDSIFRRLHVEYRNWENVRSFRSSEEEAGAIIMTTEVQTHPEEVTKEEDGSTVIRCRETTTHRLVYRTRRSPEVRRVSAASNEVSTSEASPVEDEAGSSTSSTVTGAMGHDVPFGEHLRQCRFIDDTTSETNVTPSDPVQFDLECHL